MQKEGIVNPWEVSGDVDYNRLIKEFGIVPLKSLPEIFEKNVLFRRQTIFAHRDFQKILNCVKNKKPFVLMTGLMPTGKFHLGHMLLAQQMIFYQNLGAKLYIAVADVEAYNTRGISLEECRKNAYEQYIKNYIALGLKPKNCEIYFQSERSKKANKSNNYYKLQNLVAKHVTFNEFKAVYGDITPGKMISALLQVSDMLSPQMNEFEGDVPVVVPVGIDQDPHLRLARDISHRIKHFKCNPVSSTYHLFMPGLKGGKMSSSDSDSFIALTDSEKDVENKIKRYAFSGGRDTLEEHRRLGGNPDIDVCFQYLKFFFEDNDIKLKKIYDDYKSGKMLTSELKKYTIDKINSFLKEHQKKLNKVSIKDIEKFFD
jgi:tryptophanyl-tRNA synthetase